MAVGVRPIATAILLVVGVLGWVTLGTLSSREVPGLGVWRWTVVAVAVVLAAGVPPISREIVAALDAVRHPSPRSARWAAILIGIAATAYFIFTAHLQGRDLFPKTHDDQSYLIQMQMLARGRLWMPQHALADFFDTFYVLARPRYASLYFPGAALLYVPTVWLNLPAWLMPTLVAGAIVGLVYRLAAELIDGAAGALAAAWVVSLGWFRTYSVLLTSHEPMLLLGLLLFWAWLRWRRDPRPRWALAMGALAGWAAITRPADAVCFAAPVGVGILFDLWRRCLLAASGANDGADGSDMSDGASAKIRGPASAWLVTGALLVAGAAPFLALQLTFNRGVTGRWLKTPYALYLEQDQPNTSFGFHADAPAARPQSMLRQKQDYYDAFFARYVRDHRPSMLPKIWGTDNAQMMADTALPARALLPFLAVGLLGLTDARRRAFAGVAVLFVAVYAFNTFFLEHYALLVAPAAVLLALLGARALEMAWPRLRTRVAAGFAAGLLAVCITTLPEANWLWPKQYARDDETFPSSDRFRQLHAQAPNLAPAVILFRYASPREGGAGDRIVEEPVYNTDVASPDDAPTVRAHDLGPRNVEIYRYYAARQPERVFYLYDRATGQIKELGTASALAAAAGTP